MIPSMIRRAASLLLPFAFAACTITPKHESGELGRQFKATIPGTWTGEGTTGGLNVRMVKQFNPDGSAKGVLMMRKRANGVSIVMPEVPFTSRWRVKGDVVETYDIKAGIPGLFKKGDIIRDDLVSVSPKRIVSRSQVSKDIEIITRLNSLHE